MHLEKTVVFIDEIDDLVKKRNHSKSCSVNSTEQPYDPRTLFVNSLLPRFQELHDKKNIILLMATNNIERVDEAISRMGRVDLVIPVGAISPHGRLKFLKKVSEENLEAFSKLKGWLEKEWVDFAIDYLDATEASSYGTLKHFMDTLIRKIENYHNSGVTDAMGDLRAFLRERAKKKKENQLLIWKDDVIKSKDGDYDTRPKHEDGDFHDFGYFADNEYHSTKAKFQEAFVKLFINLNFGSITVDKAEEIEMTINTYCNTFPMREEIEKGGTRENPCNYKLYNILTPFYDDIEAVLRGGYNEDVKNIIIKARDCVGEMIFGRSILPSK